jgi:hypothetical protein
MPQDLFIIEASRSSSETPHSVISPSQSPLPHTTQHSQETDICVPAGFEPAVTTSEKPQTHALDYTATGIGAVLSTVVVIA